MATQMDGRVLATASNGVPIFKSVDSLFTNFYENQLRKTAGNMGYGTAGAHNTIFGQFVSAVVFACDNALTAVGVRQWDKSGVRVATALATKGGIGTGRGGKIPYAKKPDLKEVKEEYKELPFLFGFDIGLQQLESKDDTITWQNYVELQGKTYSDAIDYDMLRPLEKDPVTEVEVDPEKPVSYPGEEIQIEKLSRIVSTYDDIGRNYNTLGGGVKQIVEKHVNPYGGDASDVNRSAGRSAFDSYVQFGDNVEQFDLVHLDKAWSGVARYWQNAASPQNKMWLMSFERQRVIGGLLSASNRFMESVFTTRDINGVSTVPGRDAGFVTKAYNDIPIISDGNINVGGDNMFAVDAKGGDVYLLDLDHIWYKALRPVDFRTTDQYQIYRELTNYATYFMEGELCSDMWACHARISQMI